MEPNRVTPTLAGPVMCENTTPIRIRHTSAIIRDDTREALGQVSTDYRVCENSLYDDYRAGTLADGTPKRTRTAEQTRARKAARRASRASRRANR